MSHFPSGSAQVRRRDVVGAVDADDDVVVGRPGQRAAVDLGKLQDGLAAEVIVQFAQQSSSSQFSSLKAIRRIIHCRNFFLSFFKVTVEKVTI